MTLETDPTPERERKTTSTDSFPEDAPYGYKADGTPYKRRPPHRKKKEGVKNNLAQEAAETLTKYNVILAGTIVNISLLKKIPGITNIPFFERMPDLTHTAEALADCQDEFTERASKALSNLPELSRKIVAFNLPGEQSALWGYLTLIACYSSMMKAVAPIAIMEVMSQLGDP